MQIIKSLPRLLLFLLPATAFSQTSYLIPGSKEYILLDRLEIKSNNHDLNFSTVKPYSRRAMVRAIESIDSINLIGGADSVRLTPVDRYNMERFLMNSSEWAKPRESFISKKPILKHFYKTKGNALEVNNEDFFLVVNPIIQYQQSIEGGNSQNVYPKGQNIFLNSRGFNIRGLIDKRVGFNLYLTENQERAPLYVQQLIAQRRSVPGQGFYKDFKAVGGTDYFDVRGSVTWNVAKFIDMQFGYDRNFIGTGHRSLFMSDNSSNALFLKINTR
ncbi:MAG: hypothetical protein JWQ96_2605, partial [Segetibacter sp.]|nr:hypothetical protein [Segetibacter sp.]